MKMHLSGDERKCNEDSDTSPSREDRFPTEAETALWVALNLAQRSIYVAMNAALKAEGLPPLKWYDVLWAVERSEKSGLRPSELEKSLVFEQSNLSRMLQRMIGEGLLKEAVCPQDRRGKLVRSTQKGRRVRKRMWKVYGPLIQEHMSKLSGEACLAQTTTALNRLIVPRD